jgi:acetyl-CoA carboxylase biotin carboxyl carrier protein
MKNPSETNDMAGSNPKDIEVFNLERIRSLVTLMEEHGLSEVDLRHEKQRIRLCRGMAQPATANQPALQLPSANLPQDKTPLVQSGQRADDDKNIVLVKSPMVGTFYSRPNPDSPPFVRVGDPISPDRIVCIIEAMKVFNEIPAEVSGIIVAVLVEDEETVDYGKPLFKVDTSK